MAQNLQTFLDNLIVKEGGYVNHPSDRGGPTKWGITQSVARSWGYLGPLEHLPEAVARAIYTKRYWEDPGFDKIAAVSEYVAEELFDTGVNTGPGVPSIWLQKWLNGFNRQQKDYPDLLVDGKIGKATIDALKAYLKVRGKVGEHVLVIALNCSQGAHYLEITKREANEDFLYGWITNRIQL